MYIYIYLYVCVCVCVCLSIWIIIWIFYLKYKLLNSLLQTNHVKWHSLSLKFITVIINGTWRSILYANPDLKTDGGLCKSSFLELWMPFVSLTTCAVKMFLLGEQSIAHSSFNFIFTVSYTSSLDIYVRPQIGIVFRRAVCVDWTLSLIQTPVRGS